MHNTESSTDLEFAFEGGEREAQHLSLQDRVLEETMGVIARRTHQRLYCNMDISSASQRAERQKAALKRMDLKELRDMIEADLGCTEEEWGPNACGTAALIHRHLGIEPRISREKLKALNLESPTLAYDVLALADGAIQDIGFYLVQHTTEGRKETGFDDLDLQHLKSSFQGVPDHS